MEEVSAAVKLRNWLVSMSEPIRDPWSDWEADDKDDYIEYKDLGLVVDPTTEFTSRSEVENRSVTRGAGEEYDKVVESANVQSCDSDSASLNRAGM